jgi:hypothetical protein
MIERIPDEVLRDQAIAVLEEELGPVETLRFLALVSRERFDYQKWRDERFGSMTIDEIIAASKACKKPSP